VAHHPTDGTSRRSAIGTVTAHRQCARSRGGDVPANRAGRAAYGNDVSFTRDSRGLRRWPATGRRSTHGQARATPCSAHDHLWIYERISSQRRPHYLRWRANGEGVAHRPVSRIERHHPRIRPRSWSHAENPSGGGQADPAPPAARQSTARTRHSTNGGPRPVVVEVAVESRRPSHVDPPRATLSDVDIRTALAARPRRPANYAQERRTFAELLVELTRDPQTMLPRLAEAARHLCRADSAGLSLLDGEVFRWEAVAGAHASSRHRTLPRAASPCGVCIDEDATQLMHLPDRSFPALAAEPRFVEILLVPVHRDGQAVGTLWIVAHTEERHFDREDESVLRTLSDLAAAALQRWSLYEAAVAANRRKDEFLAMLGHELRNPMAAILAATVVLEKIAAVPEHAVKQAFEVLRHQTRHLSRMVDDLNDLSRITQGKLDVRLQTIPLVAAVSDAVSVTRPHIDRRRQHLRVDIPDEPLEVRADQVRLTQLLANLLDNAAKYTPDGGDIRLTVSREDAHARVSVRDNGIGIAGDRLHDIFTLFTQVRPPGGYSEGLGLGLALVERLVALHGGFVTASSDGPGKGSEFTVRLPVQTVDDSRLVA